MSRDDFSLSTKDLLAKRVGYKCSNPSCRRSTSGPQDSASGSVNIGVAAHIKAAATGGKRYDTNQTSQQRMSPENGLWLCCNCAKLIDSDEIKYTTELCQEWKIKSEREAQSEIEKGKTTENNQNVIITSYNQSGGITAHTVILNKVSNRTIASSANEIVEHLKRYNPGVFRLHYYSSDTEAVALAKEIEEVLTRSLWRMIHPIIKHGGPQLPEGVTVFMIKNNNPPIVLLNSLYKALGGYGVQGEILFEVDNVFRVGGWDPVNLSSGEEGVVIYIGPNIS